MVTVCYLKALPQPPSSCCVGLKRPLSETDESGSEEEGCCSRSCQAVWDWWVTLEQAVAATVLV